ncbi:bifunctional metallophosphatase/5'-nucleotidase [Hazenella sp. IB182353]|uniref:bifunctional metallophosphatase/5'-nucleotidase n=1 Tax=Polycladospora coralii TaxID=2771432 RepID=UPI0017478BCD|nr:bifunctional UDP-sugar hydrolase/5'-nucleotidase [Polycladospora coralii]MBS7530453.1 bifunctional metallophosphatase/5'-nucleotidase [Polycladospora coralii]
MKKQKITILETSDVHGSVLPIHYGLNQNMEFGFAKLATLIKQERLLNEENTLLIDNGDLIQGTPLAYYCARIQSELENPMPEILKYLQYDAAILGNHEFNYGQTFLDRIVKQAALPYLSANVCKKKDGKPLYDQPYLVKTVADGIRVGVLGLTTHYIPNWEHPDHIAELTFVDAVASAKQWVPYLREQENVDVVVVAYHGGFERDLQTGEPIEPLTGENQGYQLCAEVPGIDVLLTGHQHRALAEKTINDVVVVQPANNGLYLGKVELFLERDQLGWKIMHKEAKLLSVESVSVDNEVVDIVRPYEALTQEWLDQPIGKIEGNMLIDDPMKVRTEKHAMIEFINHIQMEVAEVDISNTALFDNYATGFKSDVTMRDIVANYVYPNTLKVLRLTGQDIKDALEQSASYFAPYNGTEIEVNPKFLYPKPEHYNYDMWEGISYLINISNPVGDRIEELSYQDQPLALDKEYDVVMNNYRASGGGNYLMFQDKPVVREVPTEMSELIVNYFMKHKVVKANVTPTWKVIHE